METMRGKNGLEIFFIIQPKCRHENECKSIDEDA